MPADPDTFPPVAQLLPHGTPIRAVDAMTAWAPGRATCSLKVRAGMSFLRNGRVAAFVAMEWLAQAVAICLGYEAYRGGDGVRVGMIVGIRKMDLFIPAFDVGDELLLEVERLRGSEDVSTFEGKVTRGSTEVARATMTLFHASSPPEEV